MSVLVGLLVIGAGVYFWLLRTRHAALMAGDPADMAQDVQAAARNFGFVRHANSHPVDCLNDPNVATAGLGIGFLKLGGRTRTEQLDGLTRSLQVNLAQSHNQAKEALILGRWLIGECGGPKPGIDRLSRRLWKLNAIAGFQPLMAVLKDTAVLGDSAITPP